MISLSNTLKLFSIVLLFIIALKKEIHEDLPIKNFSTAFIKIVH